MGTGAWKSQEKLLCNHDYESECESGYERDHGITMNWTWGGKRKTAAPEWGAWGQQ